MSILLDFHAQSNQMMKLKMAYIYKENTLKQKLKVASNFFSRVFFKMCEKVPGGLKEIC